MRKHCIILSVLIAIGFGSVYGLSANAAEQDNPFEGEAVKVEASKDASDSKSLSNSDKLLEISEYKETDKEKKEREEEEKEKKEKIEEHKKKVEIKQDFSKDEETYSPSIPGTVEVGDSYLNVRTGVWGTIVGSLYTSNKVTITGRKGDWYIIDLNGETRYIHMNYVTTPDRASGQTPVKYPWDTDSVSIARETNEKCGWGGVYPADPPPTWISSPYGYRTHPVTGKRDSFHNGVDLPVCTGTRLNALADGVVVCSGWDYGGGNYLKIRYENGYESSYLHMQKFLVSKGEKVSAGQRVGLSDNTGAYTTGPHLHFTVRYNGQTVDPAKTGVPLIK